MDSSDDELGKKWKKSRKKLTSLRLKKPKEGRVDKAPSFQCSPPRRCSSRRGGQETSFCRKALALFRRVVKKTRRTPGLGNIAPKPCGTPSLSGERLSECRASMTSKPQEVSQPLITGTNVHTVGGSGCCRQSVVAQAGHCLPVEPEQARECVVELSEQLGAQACFGRLQPSQNKHQVSSSFLRRSKSTSACQSAMKEAKKLGICASDESASFPPSHSSTINAVAIDGDRAALSGGSSHTLPPSPTSGANNNGGGNRICVGERTDKHHEGFSPGKALNFFRSSSVSPRSSWRVGGKPAPLRSQFTYPSSECEFPAYSSAHLMSIRGNKVKTSPRHGGGTSSLSVPSSPKTQHTTVTAPPHAVPPHLRKHRRSVSALAQSFFTTGGSFRGKDPLESPGREGPTRNSIRGTPRNIIRRLKSMSGGLVASEGGEGRKYRVEPVVTKLYRLDAKAVAEELTVLDAEVFRRIKMTELRSGAWTKKDKEQLAPHVMQMVRAFNQLALLTSTEVLSKETPQQRAKVITAYIQIAEKLYQLQNFNSLKAVLAGLESSAVYRLEKTWACVSSKRKRLYAYLCSAVSNEDNWKVYRRLLSVAITHPPCIPFLGQLLTDIVQKDAYSSQRKETLKEKKTAADVPQTSPQNGLLKEDGQKEQCGAGEESSPFSTSAMGSSNSEELCRRRPMTLLPVRHQPVTKSHSHPQTASGANSLATTPSPSSTASRLSFDKSYLGFSSYSCPDLVDLLAKWDDNILARLSKRRRSTSAKAVGEPLSAFIETFNGDLENSESSGSLHDDSLPEIRLQKTVSVMYDEGRRQLAATQALSKREENGGEDGDIDRLSSLVDLSQSSFSSFEELLSLEDDDVTEDKVFRSREHTPGRELEESVNGEPAQERSFPPTPDLDLEDISVALQRTTEEHTLTNGTIEEDSPSPSPFRAQKLSRFSSFRKKARSSLKGLVSKQHRKEQETVPAAQLLTSASSISDMLQVLQFASIGYCDSCGPQFAIRRFLLTAKCNTEAENHRISLQLEPVEV